MQAISDGNGSGVLNEDTARNETLASTMPDDTRLARVNYFGSRAVSTPEVLEPMRRQLGVAHRVLNILVPQPSLQRPCVVAGVRQGVAAAVAQHVRMDRKGHFGASPDPTE